MMHTYFIVFQDFCRIHQRHFPSGGALDLGSLIYSTFEHNESGMVEFDQFIRSLSVTLRGTREEKLECKTSTSLAQSSLSSECYIHWIILICISSSRYDTGDDGTNDTVGAYVSVYVRMYVCIHHLLTCMTASLQCRFNCSVHSYRECFLQRCYCW